jgi:acyl-CoA synthetase (AMP-forming)/AMP-acid ligase II
MSGQLLAWLEDPAADRGIHFSVADDAWDFWSYERLANRARDVAAGLIGYGVARNDVVNVVQRSGPDFVATLFGVMLAGGVPSPIAPPMVFQDAELYRAHVSHLLGVARPRLVVADEPLVASFAELVGASGSPPVVSVSALLERAATTPLEGRRAAELALLQFTSGSSGSARGVRVPVDALAANVQAIRNWLRMGSDDPTASWLPVHHDMGLVGCLVTPVVNRSDVWLLQPEDFVRRPARFVRCFGKLGARLTAMPNFGLTYIARRVKPKDLDGCDFSQWRTVIVGAERVDRRALDAVTELLGPFGFDRRALLPAYGLAEATLAVTGLPLDEGWRALPVGDTSLKLGTPVELGESAEAVWLVGCGRPLGDTTVRIVDEEGRSLPDGSVGEILVRGRSVAAGYHDERPSPSLTALRAGELHTGDAGFLVDGMLYVVGRLGDSLKLRGRTLFAEDIELALEPIGIPLHRCAVLLGNRLGTPVAVALGEAAGEEWAAKARDRLRRRVEDAEVIAFTVPPGAILRTSSGKPRRRVLWNAFVEGRPPFDGAAGAAANAVASST